MSLYVREQPEGNDIGNIFEVHEAMEVLQNEGWTRFYLLNFWNSCTGWKNTALKIVCFGLYLADVFVLAPLINRFYTRNFTTLSRDYVSAQVELSKAAQNFQQSLHRNEGKGLPFVPRPSLSAKQWLDSATKAANLAGESLARRVMDLATSYRLDGHDPKVLHEAAQLLTDDKLRSAGIDRPDAAFAQKHRDALHDASTTDL